MNQRFSGSFSFKIFFIKKINMMPTNRIEQLLTKIFKTLNFLNTDFMKHHFKKGLQPSRKRKPSNE